MAQPLSVRPPSTTSADPKVHLNSGPDFEILTFAAWAGRQGMALADDGPDQDTFWLTYATAKSSPHRNHVPPRTTEFNQPHTIRHNILTGPNHL
jgi:hypothetical protein